MDHAPIVPDEQGPGAVSDGLGVDRKPVREVAHNPTHLRMVLISKMSEADTQHRTCFPTREKGVCDFPTVVTVVPVLLE